MKLYKLTDIYGNYKVIVIEEKYQSIARNHLEKSSVKIEDVTHKRIDHNRFYHQMCSSWDQRYKVIYEQPNYDVLATSTNTNSNI